MKNRRWMSLVAGVGVFVVCTVASVSARQQRPPSLPSNGSDLQGWLVEYTKAQPADGALRVGSGSGWVRTARVYSDFVMKLDVRLDEKADAGIFVRAWPTFTQSSAPSNGYRLSFSNVKPAADGWAHLEVECIGHTLTVRMDGTVVHTADALDNPQGHIALWAREKTAQFKAIEIQELPLPRVQASGNAVLVEGGVVSPKPLTRTFPRYTPEALRAKITGTVRLAGTVLPDGTVADVEVIRSLDPKLGLDRVAVETAESWRFEPGTRSGEPVAVRIMIEFEFNLR